jgi:hypothetical protein
VTALWGRIPVARRFPPPLAYFRLRRSMNFAKAIPPKTNMHSDTKITMLFITVGRFSGTCMATSSAASELGSLT